MRSLRRVYSLYEFDRGILCGVYTMFQLRKRGIVCAVMTQDSDSVLSMFPWSIASIIIEYSRSIANFLTE